jgi:hypothetical protein
MYYIVSGELPFDSLSTEEIIKSTLEGKYNLNDHFWNNVSEEAKGNQLIFI